MGVGADGEEHGDGRRILGRDIAQQSEQRFPLIALLVAKQFLGLVDGDDNQRRAGGRRLGQHALQGRAGEPIQQGTYARGTLGDGVPEAGAAEGWQGLFERAKEAGLAKSAARSGRMTGSMR